MESESTSGFEFLSAKPKFSGNKVKKLGRFFAGREDAPEESNEILEWYDTLAENTAFASYEFARAFLEFQIGNPSITPSYRVKTRTTIREKIERDNIQLSQMWDFAGVRLTVNCLHTELRMLAHEMKRQIEASGASVNERDYIGRPQKGYRAIHLLITAEAGRVEVQLRTVLQSEWANAYERVADLTGRRVRYEENFVPDDAELAELVEQMKDLSEKIHYLERNQESVQRQNTVIARSILTEPPVMALPPEFHLLRSQSLELFAEREKLRAIEAEETLNLISNLRSIQETLGFNRS